MRIITAFIAATFMLVMGLALTACGAPKSDPESTNIWQLVNGKSNFNFISIKNDTVEEIHSFKELSGSVENSGVARIVIALDSVETNIHIRNERMLTYLFETDKTPNAVLTTNIDMAVFADMAIGERKEINRIIAINMRGKTESMDVGMIVTRLGANRITVNVPSPISLDVGIFGMSAGVEKLRELAQLSSIDPVIFVSFSLVFES